MTSSSSQSQEVFQSIVKGRKSWKTLRGGEVVWPPELEAALIQGLENYQPDDSRETRLLGRYPMRNRFISDWIFDKTGRRRTAKQVGSRLQQLRDTCGGKRLLTLLSPIRRPCHHSPAYARPPLRCESDTSSDSSASVPATPTEAHATLQGLLYRGIEFRQEIPNSIVYIDLLPSSSSTTSPNGPYWTSPSQIAEERALAELGYKISRAAQYPRHLPDIDPTVTLLSPSVINARSYFTVHAGDHLIFSESTSLQPVDPTTSNNIDGILYKTSLVPGFWDTISQSSDASQYTIIQRVLQDDPSSSSTSSTIFSTVFKFVYQISTPTEQNFSISHMLATDALEQNSDFSLETLGTLLTMEEAYPYSEMMDFAKSSSFFNLSIMSPESWSVQCSPDQSGFSSPSHSQSILSDEDVLWSPASSYGIDMPGFQ